MHCAAIAFDLDDTLLRDDRTVSDYTCSVLHRASRCGIHIIPASGRARSSMHAVVERLGCASCYIACNGAEIWSPDHRLLARETMAVPLAREVARFGEEHDCYSQTYRDDCFYYSRKGPYAESYASTSLLRGVYVGDLEAYIREPVAKILMMDTAERIAMLLSLARERFADRLSVSCSKPYFLEFNPLRATKGNALRRCSELLGFDMESAVAFGDSLNDLSMLQEAGTGIAMANAREDVRALIAEHCRSNEEDGVARYVEERLLHGMD